MKSRILCLSLLLTLYGCSTSEILPDDGKMSGLRFYLPRPYITVLQEFPVATEHLLVPAYVTNDGYLVKFDSQQRTLLETMGIHIETAGDSDNAWMIIRPERGGRGLSPTSGDTPTGEAASPQGQPQETPDSNLAGDSQSAESSIDQAVAEGIGDAIQGDQIVPRNIPDGGTATATVTKGDIAELTVRVNNLFEIRYLPDMDERYVLTTKARLGNASLDAYLTSGWLVHHYGVNMDRSALGQLVFGNVQDALDVLKTVGKAAILPANPAAIPQAVSDIAGGANLEPTSEGMDRDQTAVVVAPRQLMVRITIAEYAVPGVYPILKSSELPSVNPSTGLTQLQIPGSLQQPANIAMPVAYRTRKDLHVSAIQVFEPAEVSREVLSADPGFDEPDAPAGDEIAAVDRIHALIVTYLQGEDPSLQLRATSVVIHEQDIPVRVEFVVDDEFDLSNADELKQRVNDDVGDEILGILETSEFELLFTRNQD